MRCIPESSILMSMVTHYGNVFPVHSGGWLPLLDCLSRVSRDFSKSTAGQASSGTQVSDRVHKSEHPGRVVKDMVFSTEKPSRAAFSPHTTCWKTTLIALLVERYARA